ncbi:MAG: hypothetical protein COB04_17315 [Gammaproteobacteria bacterium]|nr:MAG: hypothetical protein COB04_17315 [Gammaproteobacteria bacterium]
MAESESDPTPLNVTPASDPVMNKEYLEYLLGQRTFESAPVLDPQGKPLKALPACPLARSMAVYERTTESAIILSYFLWNPNGTSI